MHQKDNPSNLLESNSSKGQLEAREQLKKLYKDNNIPTDDLLCNLGLFTRGSALVKILVLNELYELIKNQPGAILEFGVWYGQNMVLFENLRAIYEPFNKTRKIIGFDSFDGYKGFSGKDKQNGFLTENDYLTPESYLKTLEKLLEVHEECNVLGHMKGNHELIQGDVRSTVPEFFRSHPETVVALAYFDLGLYEPTKAALEAIKPHLLPGSVLLLDEFTWSESPGEALAFKEVFREQNFSVRTSRYTPMRTIIQIGG